jgi:protease IV
MNSYVERSSEKTLYRRGFMREYFLWLFKTATLLALILIGVPLFFATVVAAIQANEATGGSKAGKIVAVVELAGAIMDSKDLVAQLYKSAQDDAIAGIVLRVDSPGGAVGPSQEIYEAVKKLKSLKPIVVSMGSVAASGGLYASMAASRVFANSGTVTGSVGVIMQFPNLEKIADIVGFKMVTVKSGALKDVGNPFRGISEGETAYLQETINAAQEQFITAIAEGRGLDPVKVREFADGRIFTGLKAKELGIVDEIGGLYDAAKSIFVLSKKPLSDGEIPKLVYPGDKLGQFKDLLALVGISSIDSNINRLFQGGLYASFP